ncbi:MAG: DNA polymerase III subunit gamma/tau [Verrucomicrobia bacterium]|nr:DNA polymerase III subunit gamma/tau [Verrucomicrobiota bacterium]
MSSSYQVFARKYRPQTFDDVVGQDHVVRTLKNAITQDRLAHAYLFVGPRGTGKTSTARILAKALNCVRAPTTEPCGVCDACREIAEGISLDVLEIDGASNNGVEQVRELRDNVRYAPTKGRFKMYIIDEVHMLTSAAFNALLKTLEEPPEHVKFVFATTEVQKVLPTILSRCQRFDLRRIPAPLIAEHLETIAKKERIQLDEAAADSVARGAEGGLRDAESMLDQLVAFCGNKITDDDVRQIFGFTAPETVAGLAGHILRRETPGALALLDEQAEAGRDLSKLLADLIAHCRDLLIFQVSPESVKTEAGSRMLAIFAEQSALVPPERLLALIDGFAAAETRMKWAPNKKLQFEIGVIKAIQTLGQASFDDVLDALAALRENSSNDGNENGSASASKAVAAATPRVAEPQEAPASGSDKRAARFAGLRETIAQPAPAKTEKSAAVVEKILPTPPPSPAVEKADSTAPQTPLDGAEIWRALLGEIRSQRPLITAWVQNSRLLEAADDGNFRVGFPADQKFVVEQLGKPNHRQFLEALLTKLAGRPARLKLELHDDAAPPQVAETPPAPPAERVKKKLDVRGLNDDNGTPAAVARGSENPNGQHGTVTPTAEADDAMTAFKNDPLIQEALKIFDGEIKGVQPPPATAG